MTARKVQDRIEEGRFVNDYNAEVADLTQGQRVVDAGEADELGVRERGLPRRQRTNPTAASPRNARSLFPGAPHLYFIPLGIFGELLQKRWRNFSGVRTGRRVGPESGSGEGLSAEAVRAEVLEFSTEHRPIQYTCVLRGD